MLQFSRSCPACQVAKPRGGKPPGLMQPVVSQRPWETVACDIIGPLPRSPRGNQYLLVVTDHFSKWVELFPLRKLVSARIWERLLDTFCRYGFPASLITDNASVFTCKVFADSCRSLNITHKRTTPYHPQANITERVNRNLKAMLVTLTGRHKDWDANISELGFATRTTVNRSTGLTPAYINLGKELTYPLENGFRETGQAHPRPISRYAADLRSRLGDALRTARENLEAARLEQAAQYDKTHRHLVYAVGDLVLRRTHPLSSAAHGFAASLAHRWEGPYRVTARVSRLTYRLARLDTGEEPGPVHVGDLKTYYLPDPDDTDGEPGRPSNAGENPRRYNLRARRP